jgi:hypothetical protein
MYIYSGYDLFANTQHWYGFIPPWLERLITNFVSLDIYLRVQGMGEFVIGLLFLAWFGGVWGVRIASIAAVLELALIIILVGIDPITFRDVGLLGAAMALAILSRKEAPRESVAC